MSVFHCELDYSNKYFYLDYVELPKNFNGSQNYKFDSSLQRVEMTSKVLSKDLKRMNGKKCFKLSDFG